MSIIFHVLVSSVLIWLLVTVTIPRFNQAFEEARASTHIIEVKQ